MIRRLLDLPGFAALEQKALMNPRYAEADARDHYDEIDKLSLSTFGITADQAATTKRPEGWDKVERKPIKDQIDAFETAGWDVTDKRRKPLRMLEHFNVQLWLAVRGVAGKLPADAIQDEDDVSEKGWAAALQAEATRFKRDRR